MKKLVIAYSGGLDTSYCAVSLSERGYDVHAVSVNTGGFSEKEIKEMDVELATNYDAAVSNTVFFESYQAKKGSLETLMEDWETVQEAIDKL